MHQNDAAKKYLNLDLRTKKQKELDKKESSERVKKHMEKFKREEKIMRERKKRLRDQGIEEGPRGGLYTNDVTKDGRPYRRYF